MAWQALDSGLSWDSPRLAIALVQSEAEMLHAPAYDLSAFLRQEPERWRVESFTARTFEGVDRLACRFDCVVLGFNAAYQSEQIRHALEALDEPLPNLLVLHQQTSEALAFLREGYALTLRALSPRATRASGRERRERREILLNWPHRVLERGGELECQATRALRFAADSHWRTVLEVDHAAERLPVMARTSTTIDRRIVVCSAWLDPADPAHAALVRNAIEFCAHGRPEIAVVAPSAEPAERGDGRLSAAGMLARKLRLQGASTVEIAPRRDDAIDFEGWPMSEVTQVILRNGYPAEHYLHAAESWLTAGGTLVGVDDDGRFTLRGGLSDAHWVAQRFAVWFHSVPTDRWLDQLFRARSVLRVLGRLAGGSRAEPARLGLDLPEAELRGPVRALIIAELDGSHDVDGLVSATAAAWDLHRLTGGALPDDVAAGVERWLRDAFETASVEDRFDIARTLRDRDLFERAAVEVRTTAVSVVCLIRMREAAAACDAAGVAIDETGIDPGSLAELDTRPQLCAEFLAALADLAVRRPDDPVSSFDSELVDRAVGTLVKHGVLASPAGDMSELEPEAVCAEAVGLISYFNLTKESTLPTRPETSGLPAAAVEPVLAETRRARQEELAARREVEQTRAGLGRAQLAAFATASLIAVVLTMTLVRVLSVDLDLVTIIGFAVAAFSAAFAFLALQLVRWNLYPRAGQSVARAVAEGVPGLKRRLAALMRDDPGPEERIV